MDFLVAENSLANSHQSHPFIDHGCFGGGGYSFSVPGILGSPPQLHCSSTSTSSQHSNSSFPSSPVPSTHHLHSTVFGHHVSPAANDYMYRCNGSPSILPLQQSSSSIYHDAEQHIPLLYTNTQNIVDTQFPLLDYLASAAADSALIPQPVDDDVEIMKSILFGDVSSSELGGVASTKNSSSSKQRINIDHLRQFCKEEMQRNSTIPVTLEEKMYREGLAAVNKYATAICKEYGLEVGALFGDDDLYSLIQ